MENGESGGRTIPTRTSTLLVFLSIFFYGCLPGIATALHETDHRFTVEGYVCGEDGKGIADVKVIVKDTRSSIGGKGITDEGGFYKAVLHLHNENQGDPLLIKALDFQEKAKVEFDSNDVKSERIITVNLGGPCLPSPGGLPMWVYYGLGAGILFSAGAIGASFLRRKYRGQAGSRVPRKRGGRRGGT